MMITISMVRHASLSAVKLKHWVAAHEAGHAAVSLALGQGHQEGVSISLDRDVLGEHVVGDQIDLAVLPRPLALFNGVRHAMVSLAGPMAQAAAESKDFDIAEFLGEAGEPGSDASHVVQAVTVLERHLGVADAGCLIIEDLVEATAGLLARHDVAALTDAIAQALVRRGRVGSDGLGRLQDRHPVNFELVKVPVLILERWRRSGLVVVAATRA